MHSAQAFGDDKIETASPAATTSLRIQSLDFIRGVALLGILLLNIVGMGLGPAYDNPTVAGGNDGVNLWIWYVVNIGFEGTQRALFSILFGAGVILLTSRLEQSGRQDAADIYFRRNMWLIAFGLIDAWLLLWEGDILYYYGVTGLFLFAFRNLPAKRLVALGAGALLLCAAWSGAESAALAKTGRAAAAAERIAAEQRSPAEAQAIISWEQQSHGGPSRQAYAQMRDTYSKSYWSALAGKAPLLLRFQSWNLYRGFLELLGTMLVGMGLFKLGALTLELGPRAYLGMMLAGYGVGIPLNVIEANWLIDHDFSALAYRQGRISYDLSRMATALGHLGAIGLFLHWGVLRRFKQQVAAVGQMALTNYLLQSVIGLTIFVLLGQWGTLQRYELYVIVAAVWGFQLAASPFWLKHFRCGPVEWLWRFLSYGAAPPFRRGSLTK